MAQLTIKTSTIFISKGKKTQVYHSVSEVPALLREEMERSTNSIQSATILIADRKGRQEIVRALNGMPNGLRISMAAKMDEGRRTSDHQPRWYRVPSRFLKRNWAEILLPAAVGTIVWLTLNYR